MSNRPKNENTKKLPEEHVAAKWHNSEFYIFLSCGICIFVYASNILVHGMKDGIIFVERLINDYIKQ